MFPSSIGPFVEDETSVPDEAGRFLQAIAEMECDAERRLRLINELVAKKTRICVELDAATAAREVAEAAVAQAKAALLAMKAESRAKQVQRSHMEAQVVELLEEQRRWEASLQPLLPPPLGTMGSSKLLRGSVVSTHSPELLPKESNPSAWAQMRLVPRILLSESHVDYRLLFLQDLATTMLELYEEIRDGHSEAVGGLDAWEAVCIASLPPLTAVERMVLRLTQQFPPFRDGLITH
ncbi:hypothetical protein ERJ75_000240500 [Trypanosoma vivax]|uniref:Uncharacterized protein n=1 Tax=Trypanosoma vivax (strain Y486) TaxID=1055687 RepID=F9WV58_TRYVY|nr:hypothetical protein TRVL_05849 [Trypanosoma vivax]KAH8618744.1 hypothetical protein ERJ75_000240500 [Trypanosoma vivax]CCD21463.1 hypothetical protein, conserved [Trypanosoma vivax Y486]|eukprot:CCD21463.1 hypothetical protein, conserved [Trypanosoma vivax Y486]